MKAHDAQAKQSARPARIHKLHIKTIAEPFSTRCDDQRGALDILNIILTDRYTIQNDSWTCRAPYAMRDHTVVS